MNEIEIKQLPPALANQIAAGEVVERPMSVIKELVENSIDAKATMITIEIEEAGIQKIVVSDNGTGMSFENLKKAYLPHATSKISRTTDLFQIRTLGFRGEALASIGAVSKMRIDTAFDTEGCFIEVADSKLVNRGRSHLRNGTIVTVESLFYNTPARLKHLSSLQTELRHIIQLIQTTAMANCHIRFTLIHNGKTIFQSIGNNDLRQTIANIYQPSTARQLVEVNKKDKDFEVEGFISPPQLTRNSRYYIHWMINHRPVRSIKLSQILTKAYGKQLMIGRYPLAVLNVKVDPRLVDVNVHPTKQTVRLSKEDQLATLLEKLVKEGLNQVNPVPQVEAEHKPMRKQLQIQESLFDQSAIPGSPTPTINQKEKEELSKPRKKAKDWLNDPSSSFTESKKQPLQSNNEKEQENIESKGIYFPSLRYVGQIHGTYLVAESPESFYLIDQHAAQERIRYERLMKYDPDVDVQQTLLMPLIFNFTASEMIVMQEWLKAFEEIGLYLEPFSPTSFQMTSYPNWLTQEEVEPLIEQLMDEFIEGNRPTIAQIKEDALIMESCRGAIKANHYLNDTQAKALIQQMQTLDDPYHCPHGRPVFVEFTQQNLEKMFKRIQDQT